jgi:ABC-type antimicrobial peptide transport system permease subunit
MEENESRPPLFGLIVLFVGAALITVGVGFLTYGLYTLMRTGIWPSYPASKMISEIGIPYPHLSWGGGQRAIDWVLASSACTVLLAIGVVIAGFGAWRIARHNRRQRLAAEAAEATA